jgi:hypothetical protein
MAELTPTIFGPAIITLAISPYMTPAILTLEHRQVRVGLVTTAEHVCQCKRSLWDSNMFQRILAVGGTLLSILFIVGTC